MPELDDLKQSAEKLADTAKESAERLSAAAKETAEIGIKVLREQIHEMVKEPAVVAKMKEMEDAFDRQVETATRQIEDGAKQLMGFWNGLLSQAKERSQPSIKVDVKVEQHDQDKDKQS